MELGIGPQLAGRSLTGCIKVPRAHTVSLAAPENRAEAVEGLTARLWVAQLAPEWALFVDIVAIGETDVDLAVNFGEGLAPEHLDCFPVASDLLVAAGERLNYHTTEEFGPEEDEAGVAPMPWETRVLTMASLQEGLQEVLRQLRDWKLRRRPFASGSFWRQASDLCDLLRGLPLLQPPCNGYCNRLPAQPRLRKKSERVLRASFHAPHESEASLTSQSFWLLPSLPCGEGLLQAALFGGKLHARYCNRLRRSPG